MSKASIYKKLTDLKLLSASFFFDGYSEDMFWYIHEKHPATIGEVVSIGVRAQDEFYPEEDGKDLIEKRLISAMTLMHDRMGKVQIINYSNPAIHCQISVN